MRGWPRRFSATSVAVCEDLFGKGVGVAKQQAGFQRACERRACTRSSCGSAARTFLRNSRLQNPRQLRRKRPGHPRDEAPSCGASSTCTILKTMMSRTRSLCNRVRRTPLPAALAVLVVSSWLPDVVQAAAPKPEKLALWPDKAPLGDGQFEAANASITVYRPAPEKTNGAAIVICPGGGYGVLVAGPEGHGIAQWLNQHGIAGIVLEYRLPRGRPFVPLRDAQRAIRTVRANARPWNIIPDRVGIIGFSAGGHLAGGTDTLPQRTLPLDTLIRQMCPCCIATRGWYCSCVRAVRTTYLRRGVARPVRHVFLLPTSPPVGSRSGTSGRDGPAGDRTGHARGDLLRFRGHARPRPCDRLVPRAGPPEPLHEAMEAEVERAVEKARAWPIGRIGCR